MNMHVVVENKALSRAEIMKAEERISTEVSGLLSQYSNEETLECVNGDLREAASRYIGNDMLYTGKSNPQIACDVHMNLADFWLGIVAAKPIESEADFSAKLTALLHHLHTDDEIELPDSITAIVGQLREYRPAA